MGNSSNYPKTLPDWCPRQKSPNRVAATAHGSQLHANYPCGRATVSIAAGEPFKRLSQLFMVKHCAACPVFREAQVELAAKQDKEQP